MIAEIETEMMIENTMMITEIQIAIEIEETEIEIETTEIVKEKGIEKEKEIEIIEDVPTQRNMRNMVEVAKTMTEIRIIEIAE